MEIISISTKQMIEVDRLMIEDYGIQLIQMMENAGRNLAELSRRLLNGDVLGKRIAVLCGSGNNGGGGMVAARHLHNWGAEVLLKVVNQPGRIKDAAAHQLRTLIKMGIKPEMDIELAKTDLILDALLGYGLSRNPQGSVATWIERINNSGRFVLALDTPSGLDMTTGMPGTPCLRAAATLTLALPKTGLLTSQARPFVGDLYLADIGVPPELYRVPQLGLAVRPLFINDTILRL